MKYILLIIGSMLIANGSIAQTIIVPGSKLINYKLLANRVLDYKMQLVTNKDEVKSEFKIHKEQIIDTKAKQIIVVQQFDMMGELVTDSTFADLKTMKPIRMSMTGAKKGNLMKLSFNGKTIKAFSKRKEPVTDTIHTIEEPYFDSNIMDCLIGALRYEKDTLFQITFYTFERNGKDPYIIRKIGEEKFKLNDSSKEIATWRIQVQPLDEFKSGRKAYDYWIDKERGILLKQELVLSARGKSRIILVE